MIIKDMRLATGCGKTVAFFSVEFSALFEADQRRLGGMTIQECKLIDGANGLFAAPYSKEYTQAGVKKYKPINKFDKDLQAKINATAIAEYRRLTGAPAEPDDIEF